LSVIIIIYQEFFLQGVFKTECDDDNMRLYALVLLYIIIWWKLLDIVWEWHLNKIPLVPMWRGLFELAKDEEIIEIPHIPRSRQQRQPQPPVQPRIIEQRMLPRPFPVRVYEQVIIIHHV
jgi:hypothetical protein